MRCSIFFSGQLECLLNQPRPTPTHINAYLLSHTPGSSAFVTQSFLCLLFIFMKRFQLPTNFACKTQVAHRFLGLRWSCVNPVPCYISISIYIWIQICHFAANLDGSSSLANDSHRNAMFTLSTLHPLMVFSSKGLRIQRIVTFVNSKIVKIVYHYFTYLMKKEWEPKHLFKI